MSEELFRCQACGSDYTHQTLCEVFAREEDQDCVPFLFQTSRENVIGVHEKPKLGINPSTRRDGIKIHLWCEGCNHNGEISIYQHKGQTFIERH